MKWFSEAFQIFKKYPWMWILLYFTSLTIEIGMSRIPFFGPIITSVLVLYFKMGLAQGTADVKLGKTLEFEHLFSAFRKENLSLISVQLITIFFGLFLSIGMSLLVFMLIAGLDTTREMIGLIMAGLQQNGDFSSDQAQALLQLGSNIFPATIIAILVTSVLVTFATMTTFFAPYFIIFQKTNLINALKLSFNGCIQHFWPLTIYGLAAIFWAIIAAIPFFLGFIIFPVIFNIANFCVYESLFQGKTVEIITE